MLSISDYETESKRLTVLNQRFAFLMNGLNYVKLRQAATNDLKYEIIEKKLFGVLENLLNGEVTDTRLIPPAADANGNKTKLEII